MSFRTRIGSNGGVVGVHCVRVQCVGTRTINNYHAYVILSDINCNVYNYVHLEVNVNDLVSNPRALMYHGVHDY